MNRILVVEDDRDIGELVGRYLEQAGFRTDLLTSGREAITASRGPPGAARAGPDAAARGRTRGVPGRPQQCQKQHDPDHHVDGAARNRSASPGWNSEPTTTSPSRSVPNELVARVRALLARARTSSVHPHGGVTYGSIVVDTERHTVSGERPGRHTHGQRISPARIPAQAQRSGVIPRRAPQRCVGLQVHGRHANRGRACAGGCGRNLPPLSDALVTVKQFGYKLLEQPPPPNLVDCTR